MKLRYYDPQKGAPASYSGNIAEWEWQQKQASVSLPVNTYAFTYDKFNRLTNANHYEGSSQVNRHTEKDMTYDQNGNLKTLKRYSNASLADNLDYSVYKGNQLTTLKNNNVSYSYQYDVNGNCTKDGLNNLNLSYNSLNLISQVTQSGTVKASYMWLSDGTKAGVRNAAGTNGYEYLGSLVYKRTGASTLNLESAGFSGGRIQVGSSQEVNYYLTDHLGSTRVVLNGSGQDIARYDYMPYGLSRNPDGRLHENRFTYNGKEDQKDFGFDYMDLGARMLDRRIVRLHSLDPLAEKYLPMTPYNFVGGNPISRVDPNGMDWYTMEEEYQDEDGNTQTRSRYVYRDSRLSNREMREQGLKYEGLVAEDGKGGYYDLFGGVHFLDTDEGKLVKKIDEAIIKYYDYVAELDNFTATYYDTEGPMHMSTNFDIGFFVNRSTMGTSNNMFTGLYYKEADAHLTYFVYPGENAMQGYYNAGTDKQQGSYGYTATRIPKGYATYINFISTISIADSQSRFS